MAKLTCNEQLRAELVKAKDKIHQARKEKQQIIEGFSYKVGKLQLQIAADKEQFLSEKKVLESKIKDLKQVEKSFIYFLYAWIKKFFKTP